MRVLIVGNGGREHALAWRLSQSSSVERIFVTRPNAGMHTDYDAVDIAPGDIEGLLSFAKAEQISLTLPGPEAPLCEGIVDSFEDAGLYAFGPKAACAKLEGSKAFAKEVMSRTGVDTAEYRQFSDAETALKYVESCPLPTVVKADGLAAGKGVRICATREEARSAVQDLMVSQIFGAAGHELIIEEFMEGVECSFIALVDGQNVVPLATSQDHKRLLDGDEGPNTGGMGAFSPSPHANEALIDRVVHEIIQPTLVSLSTRALSYRGFLYAGLMLTPRGPRVLEFNVRLGDPETQPLMMSLQSDLAEVLMSVRDGGLNPGKLQWDPRPAACIVMSSRGYPEKPEKGFEIHGLEQAKKMESVQVFHAGTRLDSAGKTLSSGGRVLGVTALGDDLGAARDRAYKAAAAISFEGAHYRKDIAVNA